MSKPHQPWHPIDWDLADVAAMKALAAGIASEEQQKRAITWIIEGAGTYEPSYASSDRDTAFACGARHVGLQIIKLVNMPPQILNARRRDATATEQP